MARIIRTTVNAEGNQEFVFLTSRYQHLHQHICSSRRELEVWVEPGGMTLNGTAPELEITAIGVTWLTLASTSNHKGDGHVAKIIRTTVDAEGNVHVNLSRFVANECLQEDRRLREDLTRLGLAQVADSKSRKMGSTPAAHRYLRTIGI